MKNTAKFMVKEYFAPLVELANDNGLIGQILRRYQELLPAADKWAAQDAEHQKKHNDPNRLPLPDPWQFLLDAPAVFKIDKTVFRAAQSQLRALRHLIHIVEGIATLNKDWYQESVEARACGNKRRYEHAIRKISDAHILNERVQADARKCNDPKLLKQMEWLLKNRRAQLVHRGERNKIEQLKKWPSWNEFSESHRLPAALVELWVRCGINSVPGLMFWRNEALTKFLKVHLDQSNLNPQSVKKTRQQLGLVPVGDKKHFVWDCSIRGNNRDRKIEGYYQNGNRSFWGDILPAKQISKAVLLSI
jgi:hypothetical protein